LPDASASPEASASGALTSPSAGPSSAAASVTPGGPLAASGSIVVLGNDYSISVVDADRRSSHLSPADPGVVAFPAWSPDGSSIAAVRSVGTDTAVVVFDAAEVAIDDPVEPVTIYRAAGIEPFYLSWSPDGGAVSFLASGPDGLSVRSAQADGSEPGSVIRTGEPLYYDWTAADRLFAHIGTGPDALLAVIGLDGEEVGPRLASPGEFRSVVVSPDGALVGYVRAGHAGASEVVAAAPDGSGERSMPLFGLGAVGFDPTGETLAAIGLDEPSSVAFTLPVGPLRLMDVRTGEVRTLLDGIVVTFWWSPDGSTIAALRVQPVGGPTASGSATPAPSDQPTEVRLLFVDVASGDVLSQSVVRLGGLFIEQLVSYFDQYALSHELWAPDSRSILLPIVDDDGETRVAVMSRDGDRPATIDGAIAFWSR
jgi:hypothetical protein